MSNPAFRLAAANSGVTALLGTAPVRFYAFGEAEAGTAKPYAVWQTVYGPPANILAGAPLEDSWGAQVDCYAMTGPEALAVRIALQAAFELDGYVVSYN